MRLRHLLTTVVLGSAVALHAEMQPQTAFKKTPNDACRPAPLRDFCRVGFVDPPPLETHRAEPSFKDVRHPLPSGVVILELGVNLNGEVVSACVLRGVRDDFDKAAQAAALESRWKIPDRKGRELGFAVTVTACTPDQSRNCRPVVPK